MNQLDELLERAEIACGSGDVVYAGMEVLALYTALRDELNSGNTYCRAPWIVSCSLVKCIGESDWRNEAGRRLAEIRDKIRP